MRWKFKQQFLATLHPEHYVVLTLTIVKLILVKICICYHHLQVVCIFYAEVVYDTFVFFFLLSEGSGNNAHNLPGPETGRHWYHGDKAHGVKYPSYGESNPWAQQHQRLNQPGCNIRGYGTLLRAEYDNHIDARKFLDLMVEELNTMDWQVVTYHK